MNMNTLLTHKVHTKSSKIGILRQLPQLITWNLYVVYQGIFFLFFIQLFRIVDPPVIMPQPPFLLFDFHINGRTPWTNMSYYNYDLGLISHWIIIKFGHYLWNSFFYILTVEICEIMSTEGDIPLAQRQWNWGSNPFFFSQTLENSNRAIKRKAWGSLGND